MLKALAEFLKRYFTSSTGSTRSTPEATDTEGSASQPEVNRQSGPSPIADQERISRFVFERSKISNDAISHRAFYPPADGCLSVARTEGLSEREVWAYGDQNVVTDRAIIARGDFKAGYVRLAAVNDWSLRIEPNEPPIGHAHIVGWPPEAEKPLRKQLALELRRHLTPITLMRPFAAAHEINPD